MFESFHQPNDILAALDGSDVQHDGLARDGSAGGWRGAGAMVDYTNLGRIDAQKLFHLAGGECGDRDDQVGPLGGGARLRGEAFTELARGVIA